MVEQILFDLGITPNLLGFSYILEAVKLVNRSQRGRETLTKVLYPEIAERLNSTPSRVERNIRHAIAVSIRLDHGEMRTLIGISPYKNNVSNGEFLFSLARAVKTYDKG